MGAKALEADHVIKRYDGAPLNAVNDVSLSVEEGEFYSFLGPSGCGKTTLLRIFAGFESATSGQVLIGGKVMNDLPAFKRPVNMVFQSYALFPHLSVFDNVAFGLRHALVKKIPKSDIAAQVDSALNTVRLSSFKDRMPSQLSGGQQQRVALARALAVRPLVLLLDEPLSALDVQIREEMQEELSRLQRELGMTFVMVTHDQSEALALSSRVAVFHAGNLEQVGSPKEIYQNPATTFVAGFIGGSNLVSAVVVDSSSDGDKGSTKLQLAGGQILLAQSKAAEQGKSVNLCIKPEAFALAGQSADEASSANIIKARVKHISYQGSWTDLSLTAGEGVNFKASLPSHDRRTVDANITLDGEISLTLPPSAILILDQ